MEHEEPQTSPRWCRFCKAMTTHAIPPGKFLSPADWYCTKHIGTEGLPEPDDAHANDREVILLGSGFTKDQQDGLRFQRWRFERGELDDDFGH